MAIRTTDPTTRDQLAYAHLIIREALCHGGAGWLDYDRAFHQQAAVAVEHLAPRIAGFDYAWPRHQPRGSVLSAVPGGRPHSGTPVFAPPYSPGYHTYLQMQICMSWNRDLAFSLEIVHTGACVLPASLHTELRIARGTQTTRPISSHVLLHN